MMAVKVTAPRSPDSVRLGLPSTSFPERERRLQDGRGWGSPPRGPRRRISLGRRAPRQRPFLGDWGGHRAPLVYSAETTGFLLPPPLSPPQGTQSMVWAQHLLAPYGGSVRGSLWAVNFPVEYFTPGTNEGPSNGEGFPGGSDSKESACNEEDLGSIPGLGRYPAGGHGKPLQYSCLENPHGQRSLAGYHPWGPKESERTERLSTAMEMG